MADYGHEKTDEMLKELEEKLNKEYEQAAKEVEKKMNDYLSKFQVKDEIKRRERDAGEITGYVKSYARMKGISEDKIDQRVINDSYNYWRTGQLMIGKRWEEMRDTLAEDFHNVNKITSSMTRDFTYDVYALNHNYGTFEVEKGSHVDTSYTLYDRHTVERLVKDNPNMLPPPGKKVSQRIREGKDVLWNKQQIQSVMTQGILQGESIPKLAKRLAKEVGDSNRKASIRNARTMTTGAQNAGRVDSYERAKDMGINMVQVWVATLDGRTRHSHAQLDGYKIEVGEEFPNGCKFPGDPDGPDEEVYNCRCTLIGQVDGVDYNVSDISERNNYKLEGMSYNEWRNQHSKDQLDHQLNYTSSREFYNTITNAKDEQDPRASWRVDVHDVNDYARDNLYTTKGGSTIAVTPSGDIISVCKNSGDIRGSDLLAMAVKMGGKKLDSYEGNHNFYVKNGFMPVSWCKWDGQYAPDGWNPNKDNEEDIIFYKYVGGNVPISLDLFKETVPVSEDYFEAQQIRDGLV